MGIDLVTIAIVFATIFVVELPDKTFIATLVMSTRFRPLLVWVGVVAAFFVQTLVAVARMSDGSYWTTQTSVIVTLAGCIEES